jgi:hypothetical protein
LLIRGRRRPSLEAGGEREQRFEGHDGIDLLDDEAVAVAGHAFGRRAEVEHGQRDADLL